jgi:hypothetical protein
MGFQYKSEKVNRKVVYYEGTDQLLKGYALCYNYDTTTDIDGNTVAEGSQCNGKFIRVEKPSTNAMNNLAGFVPAAFDKVVGPCWMEITLPEDGVMVEAYTNASCVIDATSLGIVNGSYILQAVTGDGDPLAVGVAQETVDRSGTNGIVLLKVKKDGLRNLVVAPVRAVSTGYAYGGIIDATGIFRGTAASKSYGLQISGEREAEYEATGDSNDALLKMNGSNYAENDTNFIFRGINVAMTNRDGGILGELSNNISIALKQGSETDAGVALRVDAQDLSENAKNEFGGLDIAINREGLAGTEEYGLKIRTRGTINSEVDTAINVSKDATDHGFTNLFAIETDAVNVVAATGDTAHDASDIAIPITFNGTTYYLIAQDSLG